MAYVLLGDGVDSHIKGMPVYAQRLLTLLNTLHFETNNLRKLLKTGRDKSLIKNKAKKVTDAIVESANIVKDHADIELNIQRRAGVLFNVGLGLIRRYEGLYPLGDCSEVSKKKSYYSLNQNVLQLGKIGLGKRGISRIVKAGIGINRTPKMKQGSSYKAGVFAPSGRFQRRSERVVAPSTKPTMLPVTTSKAPAPIVSPPQKFVPTPSYVPDDSYNNESLYDESIDEQKFDETSDESQYDENSHDEEAKYQNEEPQDENSFSGTCPFSRRK